MLPLPWSLVAFIMLSGMIALSCTQRAEVPFEEIRAERLNKVIMCPICPGESIDQAQNDLSVQMRGIVREQVADDWTDERIKAFWVERYGPSVILEPPRQGFGLVAWLLPPVGLASAGIILYLVLRMMRRTPVSRPDPLVGGVQLTGRELSYYKRRIESILDDGMNMAPDAGEVDLTESDHDKERVDG